MLKAEIAGEEVLSNKEITISQEMLKTSSTILNNCYPKSWETAHDYISNFYFPKDYSKCKIYDVENITPIVGTRVSGNNFSINYDSSLSWDFEQLKGNTKQDSYSGVNLYNYKDTNTVSSGASADGNGWITITGNNSSGSSIMWKNYYTNNLNLQTSTQYAIFLEVKSVSGNGLLEVTSANATSQFSIVNEVNFSSLQANKVYKYLATTKSSFDGTSNGLRNYTATQAGQNSSITFRLSVLADTTVTTDNFVYQPYVGGTPSPNPDYPQAINNVTGEQVVEIVGKNLFDKSIPAFVSYYTTLTELSTGVRATISGTGTNRYSCIRLNAKELLGKTITISATINPSASNNGAIRLYYLKGTQLTTKIGDNLNETGSVQITIPSTYTNENDGLAIVFSSNRNGTATSGDYVDYTNVQLEVGTATSYEPYIGHTYPINLGKNLFIPTLTNNGTNINQARCVVTLENDEFIFNATGSDMVFGGIVNSGGSYNDTRGILIPVEGGKVYTLSTTNSTINKNYVTEYNKDRISLGYTQLSNNQSITLKSNTAYVSLRIGYSSAVIGETYRTKVQFEKGSGSSYSPYKTPIELCKIGDYQDTIKKSTGKNLFDIGTSINDYFATNNDGKRINTSVDISDYVSAEFTTNEIKILSYTSSGYRWLSKLVNLKKNTTYTISASELHSVKVVGFNSLENGTDGTQLAYINNQSLTPPKTFNSGDYKYYVVTMYPWKADFVYKNIQIEEGSQATSYEPYGKVWYKECKIGKVVLNGSENWLYTSNGNGYYTSAINNLIVAPANNDTLTGIFSNLFIETTRSNIGNINYGIANAPTKNITIKNSDIANNNVSAFTTWLTSNNIIVYYPLATPTDTEITDTELIGQLEAIELLSGLNNISVNNFSQAGDIQIYYNYRNAETITDMIFCGVIKNTGSVSLNPREPHYCDLQVLDFKTFLSEGKTLDFVISNKTLTEAINMVINSISDYGFILGNIEIDAGNDIIGAYSTLNKTPYDVFQYLADISQSRWFTRVIDENTIAIDFYDLDKMPQADDIEYTEQYFKDNNIVDISFSYNTGDYRNKQEIISQQVYGNVNTIDNITSGGYEKTFITSQTIGRISSIKVDGIEKTFITTTEKSLGLSADFYYAAGKNEVESETSYAAGQVISISYIPLVKGRRTVNNQNEISRISEQTNRNGIISRYEERNDILDGDELTKVAETYIKYKGTPEIILNVVTVNKDLFEIGQQVYFNMPSVQDLATNYMVKKKDIEITQIGEYGNVFYTYELSSSFNSESAINFFDNQRRKAEGNIKEDEFITRNVEVDNTALIIFDGLQIEEVTPTGDNTLNSTLNSPFIN